MNIYQQGRSRHKIFSYLETLQVFPNLACLLYDKSYCKDRSGNLLSYADCNNSMERANCGVGFGSATMCNWWSPRMRTTANGLVPS